MNRRWLLVFACVFAVALAFVLLPTPATATQAFVFQSPLAPPNDNFADATEIYQLPFSAYLNVGSATTEPNEPIPPGVGYIGNTVWYRFTPSKSQSLIFYNWQEYEQVVGVYAYGPSGNLGSVDDLSTPGGSAVFLADAGTTYYLQIGLRDTYPWTTGVSFGLAATPPPTVWGNIWPYSPSTFDVVNFSGSASGEGGLPVTSWLWDFGDGTTSTDLYTTHQYAADGNYTAVLTVVAADGQTGSTTLDVRVRTLDVAITKFSVPQSAKAGQTRQLSVGLVNNRVEEYVRVELYKSVPAGGGYWEQGSFVLVGQLTQFVPVRSANRTTEFGFNYTFTPEDAAVGKVTFKAIAYMVDGHDALPADNQAIADPTKVNP
jgi:hypothetical protein